MIAPFCAALIQITAGTDPDASAQENATLANEAAQGGADFVLLPEVCNMIEPDRAALRGKVRREEEDATVAALRDVAQSRGVWISVGSVVVEAEDAPGKLANRSLLIDATGQITARYDKMHLFDVNVGTADVYRESDTYRGGSSLTLAATPWGPLGMTICYDLRFPHVYRDLAKAGAVMLNIPSAFTRPTGAAHWHVLMQARAIECGAYVLAAAQTGVHAGGRQTFGHSIAVDPWGTVLADAGTEPGITYVEIDPNMCADVRRKIPALQHDRDYTF